MNQKNDVGAASRRELLLFRRIARNAEELAAGRRSYKCTKQKTGANQMKKTSSFSSLLAREAREIGKPRYFAKATHRLASFAFFLVFAASALWSGNAQAQIVFRETFGAATAQFPTTVSTADGNWTSAACLNGMIQSDLTDSPSDGAGSTHYVRHNTASCTYTANQRVWYNRTAIAVQPNTTYFFSYWVRLDHPSSPPGLTQVVRNAVGGAAIATTSELNPALVVGSWVRRIVRFSTGSATSVWLDIRNSNIAAGGNDFSLDDIMLASISVNLTKTTSGLAGGPFGFTLTNTNQTTGTVTTTAANTPTVVDGDTGNAAVTAFSVADLNTAITINESSLPSNFWSFGSASCTNAAGAAVGTLSGRQITIPASALVAGESFTCAYTNTAAPSFGTCSSNMYLGVGVPTQLHRIDTSNNPLTYPAIGSPYSPDYNAMGYDPASNYLFATRWDTATSLYRLLRIAANGVVQDDGAITGGGINAGSGIASGEIGADGFYYVKHNVPTNEMWRVNLTTRTATLITLSQSVASGDLAWSNGLLYVQDHVTGMLSSIHPTTGAVANVGPSGFIGGDDAFGSMIGASNGVFGRRNSGGFYRFDLATGLATLISDAPAGSGDGAKCATTAVNFAADLAITKTDGSTTYTPGTNVTYSIVVSNNGPFGVQNAQVNDALPTGISSASWTCTTTSGGGTCGAASGSGAINTTANLPANGSVTYSLTLTVPSTFSGNLVNIATVTAPVGSPDSDTNNNRATDTDTQFPLPPANIANISCSSDPNLFNTAYDGVGGRLPSGADTYWQVAFTTSPASNNTGTPPAGLSYGPATVVSDAATVGAWGGQKYANAAWVSHAANAAHADFADAYYRYQFNLGPGMDPAVFRLAVDWFSDNRVYRIYVNGVDQGVVDSGNGWTGASSGTLIGPWQSGANEIIVHVQSDPNAPNTQGVTAQFTPQPLCAPATLSLNKATTFVAGGPFGFSLTNTAQATGTITTSAADTPAQVDGDTSSAGTVEPFTVSTFGADVVITENSLPSGWLLNDAMCTSGGTPVGSRSGSAYTIPGGAIDASAESFVCTFTNAPTVNLRIDKTANPTALRTGDSVTYTIVLNNDGPGPGDGARFFDPAVAGVDCSAATLTCSAASGGAVCPTSPAVVDLQGSGITIPTFPAGSSMQFTMACAVTANGAP